jgi:hypothetical protein
MDALMEESMPPDPWLGEGDIDDAIETTAAPVVAQAQLPPNYCQEPQTLPEPVKPKPKQTTCKIKVFDD